MVVVVRTAAISVRTSAISVRTSVVGRRPAGRRRVVSTCRTFLAKVLPDQTALAKVLPILPWVLCLWGLCFSEMLRQEVVKVGEESVFVVVAFAVPVPPVYVAPVIPVYVVPRRCPGCHGQAGRRCPGRRQPAAVDR